ncbi:MAG: hypothetical protein ACLSHG_02045 [Oscillospiraceae bacterium]
MDYIERVKIQQRNWIGRSDGHGGGLHRPPTATSSRSTPPGADTLFGATYMVISPEHPLSRSSGRTQIENWDAVDAYQEEAARKSDFERGELNKEKDRRPARGHRGRQPRHAASTCPLFVSDYVLMGYGTGIVMGVPGHDQRDWEFATKFGLPIVEVVQGGDVTKEAFVAEGRHAASWSTPAS